MVGIPDTKARAAQLLASSESSDALALRLDALRMRFDWTAATPADAADAIARRVQRAIARVSCDAAAVPGMAKP
jgi:hypothetical protein